MKVSTVLPKASEIGTTTLPFGRTSGCPPMTEAPGTEELDHVVPPLVERLIFRMLPSPASSHST